MPWSSATQLPSSQANQSQVSEKKARASPDVGAQPPSFKVNELMWFIYDHLDHRIRRSRDRYGSS
ncbi:MAG: hypothetical protein F6K29_34130 [Okeania sp. SIO2G5]|nr:hypothetical protein [Okeania sp. SIO2G5]